MLGHLIRKELLDHISSLRFLILSAIGTLVIWLSLYSGYTYYQASLHDYQMAQMATEERIREMAAAEDWTEYVTVGYLSHKPPTSVSIFIRGLEPTLGRSIPNHLTVANRRLNRSSVEVNPFLGIFSPLDLGLIVQVVLSLFILLFSYDTVCGEKESGTLRLIGSFPAPRHSLLLGKLVGVLFSTLAAFGLPLLLGFAVMLLRADVQFTGPELNRLGLIFAAFIVYLMAFTCVGLLGSCLAHRPSTSFVLLLGFWVVSVVVLPRLSLIVADRIRPSPSIYELEADKAAVTKLNVEKARTAIDTWREAYRDPTGKRWFMTPDGREAYAIHSSKTWKEVSIGPSRLQHAQLERVFRNRYVARLDLAVALARISPSFAFNNATIGLAGSGLNRQQRFLEAFKPYYQRHRGWRMDSGAQDQLKRAHPEKYGEPKWDVSDMPRFHYQETWPEEDIQTALIDIWVLTIWGLIAFLGAYMAMLRYDVR